MERRRRFGIAGRARALERFDERDVVRIVMETYGAIAILKGRSALG